MSKYIVNAMFKTRLLPGLLYAFIFGQVTAIIQQFQRASSIYHEKLRQMRQFVKLYGVSEELSTRLIDYFMSTWQSNKGIDVEDVSCPLSTPIL